MRACCVIARREGALASHRQHHNNPRRPQAPAVLLEAIQTELSDERSAPHPVTPAPGARHNLPLDRVGSYLQASKVYPSLEAAAVRRRDGTFIGSITLPAARLLCERGCVSAPGHAGQDGPVVFRCDPCLKQVSKCRNCAATCPHCARTPIIMLRG